MKKHIVVCKNNYGLNVAHCGIKVTIALAKFNYLIF